MDTSWQIRIRDFERSQDGCVYYIVEVQTPAQELGGKPVAVWSVNRRFSDFLTLRKALRTAYPLSIVPPLPGKSDIISTVLQRFSPNVTTPPAPCGSLPMVEQLFSPGRVDFGLIDYRCYALQSFLRHCLLHSRLSCDPLLRNFMSCDVDWTSHLTCIPYNPRSPTSLPSSPTLSNSPVLSHVECTSDLAADSSNRTIPSSDISSSLLVSRTSAMKTAFRHIRTCQEKLAKYSGRAHRLHKDYAEALCQWSCYENKATAVADALQVAGHECDSYSFIMDSVLEEAADLMEQFSILENYGTSLTEVRQAYRAMQDQSDSTHTRGSAAEDTPLAAQPVSTSPGKEVLLEVLQFESLYRDSLKSLFHTFACLQLRRAERCKRIWERILTHVTNASKSLSPETDENST
ncbi:hypothetical protein T265_12475 [Opisthorchis viverrini]|uniref:PX domain-containing protein n=1 Tax=Opisthorchis viverrini TaxID=6198 RepID=A0A075A6K2_OPIVI|nr:hypothetical protein T265_12475 [Opisthorchis viverrini]KER33997.1 hypothetical protein T265_12475 [Opisthorchis viverrini]